MTRKQGKHTFGEATARQGDVLDHFWDQLEMCDNIRSRSAYSMPFATLSSPFGTRFLTFCWDMSVSWGLG